MRMPMDLPRDFEELLAAFGDEGARYVLGRIRGEPA